MAQKPPVTVSLLDLHIVDGIEVEVPVVELEVEVGPGDQPCGPHLRDFVSHVHAAAGDRHLPAVAVEGDIAPLVLEHHIVAQRTALPGGVDSAGGEG